MFFGRVRMGSDAATMNRWHNDRLLDCSPDDRIWGYSARSCEVIARERKNIDDEVLIHMLYLSLLDPKAGAPAWSEGLSVRQSTRLAANSSVRILQRVLRMDATVRALDTESFLTRLISSLLVEEDRGDPYAGH